MCKKMHLAQPNDALPVQKVPGDHQGMREYVPCDFSSRLKQEGLPTWICATKIPPHGWFPTGNSYAILRHWRFCLLCHLLRGQNGLNVFNGLLFETVTKANQETNADSHGIPAPSCEQPPFQEPPV